MRDLAERKRELVQFSMDKRMHEQLMKEDLEYLERAGKVGKVKAMQSPNNLMSKYSGDPDKSKLRYIEKTHRVHGESGTWA